MRRRFSECCRALTGCCAAPMQLMSSAAMAQFRRSEEVSCRDPKGFLLDTSQRLKWHAEELAEAAGRPFEYVSSASWSGGSVWIHVQVQTWFPHGVLPPERCPPSLWNRVRHGSAHAPAARWRATTSPTGPWGPIRWHAERERSMSIVVAAKSRTRRPRGNRAPSQRSLEQYLSVR